jgi:hypothetical protein
MNDAGSVSVLLFLAAVVLAGILVARGTDPQLERCIDAGGDRCWAEWSNRP